jgi:hypothetical protein
MEDDLIFVVKGKQPEFRAVQAKLIYFDKWNNTLTKLIQDRFLIFNKKLG